MTLEPRIDSRRGQPLLRGPHPGHRSESSAPSIPAANLGPFGCNPSESLRRSPAPPRKSRIPPRHDRPVVAPPIGGPGVGVPSRAFRESHHRNGDSERSPARRHPRTSPPGPRGLYHPARPFRAFGPGYFERSLGDRSAGSRLCRIRRPFRRSPPTGPLVSFFCRSDHQGDRP